MKHTMDSNAFHHDPIKKKITYNRYNLLHPILNQFPGRDIDIYKDPDVSMYLRKPYFMYGTLPFVSVIMTHPFYNVQIRNYEDDVRKESVFCSVDHVDPDKLREDIHECSSLFNYWTKLSSSVPRIHFRAALCRDQEGLPYIAMKETIYKVNA